MWLSLISCIAIICVSVRAASEFRRAPVWESHSQDYLVLYANEDLTLDCSAKRKKTIQWLKDGKSLYEMDSFKYGRRNDSIVEGSNYLIIKKLVSRHDSGEYTCIVGNEHGQLSHTVRVDVLAHHVRKPAMVNRPSNVTVFEGETAALYCLAYTDLTSRTQWLRHYQVNGSFADPQTGELFFNSVEKNERIHWNKTHLVIVNATVEDTARYSCFISNELGRDVSSAWIVVKSKQQIEARNAFANHNSTRPSSDEHVITFVVMVISFGGGSLVILTGVITLCYKHVHCKRSSATKLAVLEPQCDVRWPSELVGNRWHINSDSIKLCEPIGEGAFGRVYRAVLSDNQSVAVKMPKESATDKEVDSLLKEVSLMSSLKHHDNVIKLLGCSSTINGTLQIVMEYANHGNLRSFLHTHKPEIHHDGYIGKELRARASRWLNPIKLIEFSVQIARGMQFLASLKIIHRDLAARNILVAKDADDYVLKIADFGLTRETIDDKDYYRPTTPGRLPIKWLSPESMTHKIYSTKTDVWSFGVLLWEIFTYGENPYPAISLHGLHELLKSGYRMPPPAIASDNVYYIMLLCWQLDPNSRPTFAELAERLSSVYHKEFEERPMKLDLSDFPNYIWRVIAVRDDNGNLMSKSTDSPLLSYSTC